MGIKQDRMEELNKFQQKIGFFFKNTTLLNAALTHSSYANEEGLSINQYNERLEFLGDAVLEMIASEFLFREFNDCPEGTLTKIRAALVRKQALAEYASDIGIGEFILLGKGEEVTGGRKRISILADAFEAVIGAIYLDGGYIPARDFTLNFIKDKAPNLLKRNDYDSKTCLQEAVQAQGGKTVEYKLVNQWGPDHDKRFMVQVLVNNQVLGEGIGRSKKEAEQNAASKALEKMVR